MSRLPLSGLIFGLFLSTSLSAQTLMHTFEGDSNGDEFGYTVDGAGDVNNDGVPDLIVGADRDDDNGSTSGKVTVFDGATGNVLQTWVGARAQARMGNDVAGAGDVNNDGFDDVIFAEYHQASSYPGVAYVYSGKDWSQLYRWEGDGDDHFGATVAGIGDLNNDGFDDVAVGAAIDSATGRYRGAVYVFSGQTGALIYSFFGELNNDFFGSYLAGGKDVNGDTVPDLVASTNNGKVYVLSGADGSELWRSEVSGEYGRALDMLDDITGDGKDEVIVGDVRGIGYCWVLSGADGTMIYRFQGNATLDGYAWGVAGLGDTNGDGVADIAVGSYGQDFNGSASGTVYIHSGADGSEIFRLVGRGYAGYLGWDVSSTGDMNADGFDDLIVAGTPPAHTGSGAGYVQVFSGRCLGQAYQYGAGYAGTGGFVPLLDSCGCPAPHGWFTIKVSDVLGGAPGVLVMGTQGASIPIFGGRLLVMPPFALLPLQMSNGGPGEGAQDLSFAMPDNPVLIGATLYMQAILTDGGTPFGHSMTNGLVMLIQ